ncbi:hypothetical protein D5F01_LYC25197 [Larimichthys crocea]|uniref:Uncharacterized protein n=1 Tax=Larimichthys crocea TaxID=215358 RepID=A0A6G0HDE7_LARCR|nr:hypothetical protein D5F01_LYC25197 [Larimichthys crocea]
MIMETHTPETSDSRKTQIDTPQPGTSFPGPTLDRSSDLIPILNTTPIGKPLSSKAPPSHPLGLPLNSNPQPSHQGNVPKQRTSSINPHQTNIPGNKPTPRQIPSPDPGLAPDSNPSAPQPTSNTIPNPNPMGPARIPNLDPTPSMTMANMTTPQEPPLPDPTLNPLAEPVHKTPYDTPVQIKSPPLAQTVPHSQTEQNTPTTPTQEQPLPPDLQPFDSAPTKTNQMTLLENEEPMEVTEQGQEPTPAQVLIMLSDILEKEQMDTAPPAPTPQEPTQSTETDPAPVPGRLAHTQADHPLGPQHPEIIDLTEDEPTTPPPPKPHPNRVQTSKAPRPLIQTNISLLPRNYRSPTRPETTNLCPLKHTTQTHLQQAPTLDQDPATRLNKRTNRDTTDIPPKDPKVPRPFKETHISLTPRYYRSPTRPETINLGPLKRTTQTHLQQLSTLDQDPATRLNKRTNRDTTDTPPKDPKVPRPFKETHISLTPRNYRSPTRPETINLGPLKRTTQTHLQQLSTLDQDPATRLNKRTNRDTTDIPPKDPKVPRPFKETHISLTPRNYRSPTRPETINLGPLKRTTQTHLQQLSTLDQDPATRLNKRTNRDTTDTPPKDPPKVPRPFKETHISLTPRNYRSPTRPETINLGPLKRTTQTHLQQLSTLDQDPATRLNKRTNRDTTDTPPKDPKVPRPLKKTHISLTPKNYQSPTRPESINLCPPERTTQTHLQQPPTLDQDPVTHLNKQTNRDTTDTPPKDPPTEWWQNLTMDLLATDEEPLTPQTLREPQVVPATQRNKPASQTTTSLVPKPQRVPRSKTSAPTPPLQVLNEPPGPSSPHMDDLLRFQYDPPETALYTRHDHEGDKDRNWSLRPQRKCLVVGDSNMGRLPKIIDDNVQVDCYPGAKFSHATHLLNKKTPTSPDVEVVILSFGINNRDKKNPTLIKKDISRLLGAAQATFPFAKIYIPRINFNKVLPPQIQVNLNNINKIIKQTDHYIERLPTKDFLTGKDGIHWTPNTGAAIYAHWKSFLVPGPHHQPDR